MMEERGFATVALGLVRYQMEQVCPPRGLWTPFQLGRPLGEPEDASFQRRVLMDALHLLERADGPAILEDFPDDPPGWHDRPDWCPPISDTAEGGDLVRRFADEVEALQPAWKRARARHGRTTVGLCGQAPAEWAGCAEAVLAGALPVVPPHATTALAVRFMADDIKAFYSEAAQADGLAPASRQIDGWFWSRTAAGQLLVALRTAAMASPNNALRTVGGRFFVPVPFLPPGSKVD